MTNVELNSHELGSKIGRLQASIDGDIITLEKAAISLESLDTENVSLESYNLTIALLADESTGKELVKVGDSAPDKKASNENKESLIKRIKQAVETFIRKLMMKIKKYITLIMTSNKMLTKKVEKVKKLCDDKPNLIGNIKDKNGEVYATFRSLYSLMGTNLFSGGGSPEQLLKNYMSVIEYATTYKRFIPEYKDLKDAYSVANKEDAAKKAVGMFKQIADSNKIPNFDVMDAMTFLVKGTNKSKTIVEKAAVLPVEANSKVVSGVAIYNSGEIVFLRRSIEFLTYKISNNSIGKPGDANKLMDMIYDANKDLDSFKDKMKKDIDDIEKLVDQFKKDVSDGAENLNDLNKAVINLTTISARVAMGNVNNLFNVVKDGTSVVEHIYKHN